MESKKVEFFNKLSFVSLLFTIFASIFFFIPYNPITLEASKGFLVSVGATLSLFFWLISRLGDGRFLIPKDKLLLVGAAIPLIFLISSFFSSSLYVSLFGSGFEVGTFGSVLVLFIVFFLSSLYFQSEKRLWYFIWSLFLSASVVSVFLLINIFIGFNTILPGFFQGVSQGNLIGSWNNFGLFFGMMVLLSLFTLELLHTKGVFKVIQYVVLSLGVLFLIIINAPFVWLMVGAFSVIMFVYSVSLQRAGVKIQGDNKGKFPFTSLILIFVSILFLVGSNLLTVFVSKYLSLENNDIRPSIVTTSQIAWKAIKHNPAFGTGPNTFSIDWALWQPKGIAQTVFWNSDFSSGFSTLTTLASTVGIIGFLAFVLFLIIYAARSVQSIKIALTNNLSNYFIMVILMISMYSWLSVILYNPNIVIMLLAFCSSGILIGILVSKNAVPVKDFSFLSDPRHSFFSILGLLVLMLSTISLTYVYTEKFVSVMYFSNSLKSKGDVVQTLDNAEIMLQRAIMLDKNDVYYRSLSQIYVNKINYLVNSKEISEDTLKSSLQQLINLAQEKAQLAVSQNSKQYLNYVNLGNVYSALIPLNVVNGYESAMNAFTKAQEFAPNNPSIMLSKATVEFINKNNTEARKYIKEALAIKQNYIDAIFLLVQIETDEGNLSEAIKQAEFASEVAPNDPTVFFRLGLLRYNKGDYQPAVSAFEKAVILDNTYLNARFFLGQAYKKVGRSSDALVQFEILSKIDPNNQEIKDAISSVGQTTQTETETETESDTKPPLQEKR